MNSRTSWPATPEILAKAFWRARAAKNYEEMEALWPGSGSWAWPAICQLDPPVNYVFGKADKEHPAVGESVCVPYASEAYFRSNHAYNLNMLISSFATSQGQRFYIVSGNVVAKGMPVQGASSESQDFGPLVERVIRPQSNCCWALNLASGTLVSSTREQPLDFRVGQADSLRTAKVDLYQPLEANTSDTVKALDMRLVSLGPEAWNTPASEVVAQLDKAAAVQVRQSEAFINGSSVYVFSTREGAKGLLQILKDTVPAKIRYKLIQKGATNTAAASSAVPPTVPRVVPKQILEAKLRQAELELARVGELRRQNLIGEAEYERAKLAVEAAMAEAKEDTAGVARVKVKSAEQELSRAEALYKEKTISGDEYEKAKLNLEAAKAELQGDAVALARIKVQYAEQELKRAEELFQRKVISAADLETTKLNLEIAREELKAAEALPPSSQTESPRAVIAEWLRRIKAGTRDAWDLTTRSNNVGWGPSFTGLWEYDRIRPLHQLGNEEQAMVVSNPFNDNAGQTRIFYAVLRKRDGQWLVDRHDYVSPSEASGLVKGFSLNPGTKFDVLAAELVGEWRAVCDSTISLAADGTGTQLRVGPGGPEPGAKPESFKWEVSGPTLRRHFADRQEKLEMTWVDDDAVQFHSPNDSGWGSWWRTPQVYRHQPSSATNEARRTPEKAAAIPSKLELSFGPVIERVLDFDTRRATAYLDLDTGEYFDPGAKVTYGMMATPAGVDLKASAFESNTRARLGVNLALAPVDAARWDATPDEIRKALAGVHRQAEVRLDSGSRTNTFFFRTSEGSMGVLQITPFRDDESKVTVRYKLVQLAPRVSDSSIKTNETELPHRSRLATTDAATKAILAYGGFIQRDLQGGVVCVNLVYNEDEQGRRRECTNRSDTIAACLTAFPDLQKLLLRGAQASDGAMQFVAQLRGLKELYMWDAVVRDEGIARLANLQQLEYLHLNNGFISDAALEVFASLPRLEGLSLRGNHFTDEGLAFLGRMKQLKRLWLGRGDCRITDAGLKLLSELENLEELELQGHPITDEGLKHLYSLSKLRRVYLHGTRVTAVGVYKLSHAIPGSLVDFL
jgi:multidrug resistance efflux pump